MAFVRHVKSPAFLPSLILPSFPSPSFALYRNTNYLQIFSTFNLSLCCLVCLECPFLSFTLQNFIKGSSLPLRSRFSQCLSSERTHRAHCCQAIYHPVLRLFVYTSLAFVVCISPSSPATSLSTGSERPFEGRNCFFHL